MLSWKHCTCRCMPYWLLCICHMQFNPLLCLLSQPCACTCRHQPLLQDEEASRETQLAMIEVCTQSAMHL